MARDDNQYKTAHQSTPGTSYGNDKGHDNHSGNGEHRNNVGNDEGWLSALLGALTCERYTRCLESRCAANNKRCPLAAHLWNPELRKAFTKLAWELLPDLLQASSPPWMQSIELTK